MVFKIRNKGYNVFNAAQHPRVGASTKVKLDVELGYFQTIQVNQTRYSTLRMYHGYRNISRASKQFMMGDRLLEQVMIMNLKLWFTAPLRYESPIEQSHWLARNLADFTDRHSALFSNN